VTTYRNGGEQKEEKDGKVHLHRIPDTRRFLGRLGGLFSVDFISLNFSLVEYAELIESADIVHTFTPIFWRFFDTTLVSHYHHWDESSELIEYLYLPFYHKLLVECYHKSDRIIAVSEYSKQDLVNRGISEQKIKTVPNGVDTEIYHPGPSSIEFEWNTVLLYVGPLTERKGIKYLLYALRAVLSEHSDVGLVLVGDGNSKRLENLTKELKIENHVRFEGFVPENDLPEYYRSSDVFVFPSLLEGFGMVLLEAMASGLPVISTRTSAIPEVVGDAGILVEPRNIEDLEAKITDFITNSKMEKFSKLSTERVQNNFTWERTAILLVENYENTIASS
jgi:glycosyltransferase involved in cell wall biosynthesis